MKKLVKYGCRLVFELTLLVCSIPIVIVIRLIRPIRWIRFGYFSVDRIGHFSFDVEYYLSAKNLGREEARSSNIFFLKGKESNNQLGQMSRRSVVIHPLVRYLYRANDLIPFGRKYRLLPAREVTNSRDLTEVMSSSSTQIKFTEDENYAGAEFLNAIGIERGDRLVVLLVRDSAYLKTYQRGRDWSYHDFRDTDIDSYREIAVNLAKKGYWVFRMGKIVEKPLKAYHHRIIDYANSEYRSDFLDIWLIANCYFAISTGLGLGSVADIFRRPIVFVNYLPVVDLEAWGPNITVPKHLVWASDGSPLTLRQHLEHTKTSGHYYKEKGIEVNDLNSNEITEAVLELEARLSQTWEETEEDFELQKRFWEELRAWPGFNRYHGWIHPEARVGAVFLRKCHSTLLM